MNVKDPEEVLPDSNCSDDLGLSNLSGGSLPFPEAMVEWSFRRSVLVSARDKETDKGPVRPWHLNLDAKDLLRIQGTSSSSLCEGSTSK